MPYDAEADGFCFVLLLQRDSTGLVNKSNTFENLENAITEMQVQHFYLLFCNL